MNAAKAAKAAAAFSGVKPKARGPRVPDDPESPKPMKKLVVKLRSNDKARVQTQKSMLKVLERTLQQKSLSSKVDQGVK